MRTVVAYVPDLMDRSRVQAAAPAVRFVGAPGDLTAAAEGADVVVVDLSRPGAIDALPPAAHTVIGFAPHVDRDLLKAARDRGCTEVLPRSQFFRRAAELLG